ncbi:MAG: MFS transporter [SAR324 cluster bacterium]|nr:MFS transporter [SAR324 cluster bacterium]MCZ6842942.1 MFS transporter [SAR324 cluster bacterium]
MLVDFFRRRNIYYGWVVLAVTFVTMFFVMGFRISFGVFYVVILDETGWTRAETAGIFSTAMIVYAFSSMLAGAMFDWLGPRRIFPIGSLLLGGGLMLCSTIQTLWQFYLYYGVLVGLSYSLIGFITHMAYIPRWFIKNRGLASSLGLSGMGVGALVIAVLSEQMLVWFGWRTTFFIFGATMWLVLTPLTIIFHRESPQSIGLRPDGRPGTSHSPAEAQAAGPTLLQSVRRPVFWMLFTAVLTIGMGSMTIVVHLTRLLVDAGYAFSIAAALLGLTGLLRSLGGMFWGALSDRVGRAPCIWAASLLGFISLILLIAMGNSQNNLLLGGFILLWGMGFTGIPPLYASTAADIFQGRHFGKILGTLDQGFGIGAATGPFLAGWIYDNYGSYEPLLWILMGVVLLTASSLWSATLSLPGRTAGGVK